MGARGPSLCAKSAGPDSERLPLVAATAKVVSTSGVFLYTSPATNVDKSRNVPVTLFGSLPVPRAAASRSLSLTLPHYLAGAADVRYREYGRVRPGRLRVLRAGCDHGRGRLVRAYRLVHGLPLRRRLRGGRSARFAVSSRPHARWRACARQTYKIRSRFLASVSHEMKTPLNAIIGPRTAPLRQRAPC
jgi:signal transduction histidine kinase